MLDERRVACANIASLLHLQLLKQCGWKTAKEAEVLFQIDAEMRDRAVLRQTAVQAGLAPVFAVRMDRSGS